MSTTQETLKNTSTPEVFPQEHDLSIAGTLRDPLVRQIGTDQLSVTYHWETPDDKHTYLHLLLRKSPEDLFGTVHTNFDSEDIKGQGDALWKFAGEQLQDISDRGNFQVRHEVDVNDYSRRLPEADPRYEYLGENKYRGLFNPTPPHEPVLRTYHSERVNDH